jgi:acetate---CoA ligase (ADP-forming)
MSTQSGALGLATLDYARKLNIGFSSFISVGNKADVSGNDLVQYWGDDPRTEVILLYLESFGNPKKFARIAPRVARKKPIVAVKSGRFPIGARVAHLHTGARSASDAIVADLFRQAGIIRTDTLEEMFDVAMLLANQPLPKGRRVAIVTNAGGPAVLAADACEAHGLELASLGDATAAALREALPAAGSVDNPVDLTPDAGPGDYGHAMRALLADPGVDALLVIHIPIFAGHLEPVALGIAEAASAAEGKTIVGTIMSARGVPEALAPLPCFPFPERAVAALARVRSYAEWRQLPVGTVPKYDDIDGAAIRETVSGAAAAGRKWMTASECRTLLRLAGIEMMEAPAVRTLEEAIAVAERVRYPVVMKAVVSTLRRESEIVAVRHSLASDLDVAYAWGELTVQWGERLSEIVVQKMIAKGCDGMIGVTEQPTFGHLLYYGAAAGSHDVTPEIEFRLHPLTDRDAAEMAQKPYCTAAGRRTPLSQESEALVAGALLRLSALIDLSPGIREIEIARLKVLHDRVVALEAAVRIGRPEPGSATARRITY